MKRSAKGRLLESMALWDPLQTAEVANTNRSVFLNAIRRNAGASLTEAQLSRIVDAIDYKSAANMHKHLDQATTWLRQKVRGRPYALAVGMSELNSSFKSSEWLMRRAIQGIGSWPAAFLPAGDDYLEYRDYLDAMKAGIKVFVVFDDAVYSGSDMFRKFAASFKTALQQMKRERRSTRGLALYQAAGYFSNAPQAVRGLAGLKSGIRSLDDHVVVEFFAPGRMRSTANFLASLPAPNRKAIAAYLYGMDDINNMYDTNNLQSLNQTTMTMLASKVPDRVSFQRKLGDLLKQHVPSPYKRLGRKDIPASARVVNSRRQGVHIVHVHANSSRKRYTNRGGVLQRTRKRPRSL